MAVDILNAVMLEQCRHKNSHFKDCHMNTSLRVMGGEGTNNHGGHTIMVVTLTQTGDIVHNQLH